MGGVTSFVVDDVLGFDIPKHPKMSRRAKLDELPEPIKPPKELEAPKMSDADIGEAQARERRRTARQKGRASTLFRPALGDDNGAVGRATARTTLGA